MRRAASVISQRGGVARCVVDGLLQLLLHGFGKALDVAYDLEADVVFHEDLVFKRRQHESHERCNFVGGAVPVLC